MMRKPILVLAATVLALAGHVPVANADPLVVRTEYGLVRGSDGAQARTFSGIRYAAPPVGELRWAEPRPPRPWDGVADATKPGNSCPQAAPGGEPVTTEDCLFVNVTVPEDAGNRPLPVMVWLHGGGYTNGSGAAYDASRMAAQGDVIVVTVNYRLGVFGYFGLAGLPGSGDFGLADQLAALRWTQRNIAAFGGDAGNVTLFGQSAGGMSTCALLTSPAAKGLFHQAGIASGSCLLDWPRGVLFPRAGAQTPYSSLAETNADGAAVAQRLGCAGPGALECLRGLPAARLLEHHQTFANHLTYGTPLLPRHPAEALRVGAFHPVPVISGGTQDEMRSFIGGAAMIEPITEPRYHELMRNSFGERADEVLARYPLDGYSSPAVAWSTVTTDLAWSCPTLTADRLLDRRTTVYAYEFADPDAPNVNGIEVPDLPQESAHATDMPYLFDLGGRPWPFPPAQRRLADTMVTYWTTFAHTGDPNGPGTPHWPRFHRRGPVLSLAPDAVRPAPYAADHQCRFWR